MIRINKLIEIKILSLKTRHKMLSEFQAVQQQPKRAAYIHAKLELNKAWIELKIAILKSLGK